MQRHTRAHVREQRSRWIRKRIGQIRRVRSGWTDEPDPLRWYRPLGSLSKKDPFDCGNTRCGICHCGGNERREGRERAIVECELSELWSAAATAAEAGSEGADGAT